MSVKEMRMKLGMTQEMFSHRYNIPKRTIENWESGKRTPPAYVLEMLEDAVRHYKPRSSEEVMSRPLTVIDLKYSGAVVAAAATFAAIQEGHLVRTKPME